ncbi:MAG: tyrosine-type recombinase/integrase [Alphaproteobacteria bacterium]|nr:tyrosine-type recombinase/integrase [Alphaproteobacteria bacterium]
MRLNKTFIVSLKQHDKPKTYWDSELKGFGLRVQGKSKSWVIMYRNAQGKQKMLTLSKIDKLTPDEARKEAKRKLADVTKGKDPASEKTAKRKAMTVSELCDFYMKEGCENKKPYTIKMDIGRIERHIKPLIGNLAVTSLTTAIVEKMMIDIARGKTAIEKKGDKPRATIKVTGGKGTANRTMGMFASILEFAKRYKIIERNPARGVKRFASQKKDVFLDIEEIQNLGKALQEAGKQGESQRSIEATKLLLLTGCRKMEVLSLKWEYVDFKNKCFRFPDTKTGKQIRAFGQGALDLLVEIKHNSKSKWVFPSSVNDKHFIGLPKAFRRIRKLEDTETGKPFIGEDITLHTLRHSFASIAADIGFTELTIAGLLGHSLGGVTNRYSHNVDSSLISAADKVSLRIETALEDKEQANNVIELKIV